MSCVTCHLSHVRHSYFPDKVVKLVGGGSVINWATPSIFFFNCGSLVCFSIYSLNINFLLTKQPCWIFSCHSPWEFIHISNSCLHSHQMEPVTWNSFSSSLSPDLFLGDGVQCCQSLCIHICTRNTSIYGLNHKTWKDSIFHIPWKPWVTGLGNREFSSVFIVNIYNSHESQGLWCIVYQQKVHKNPW